MYESVCGKLDKIRVINSDINAETFYDVSIKL